MNPRFNLLVSLALCISILPGSDFTVGAVHRFGEMGNNFVGQIGGIAEFDRALMEDEIRNIYENNTK